MAPAIDPVALTPEARLAIALEGLVVGAVGMTSSALEAFSQESELTLQQWRALVVVARTDGIRIGDVGSRVGLTGPSTSRLVRRLERRGLVVTDRDESDRRGTIVRTTARGHELWWSLVQHRRLLILEALSTLRTPVRERLVRDVEQLEAAFARFA